jgi:hypothetical protein
VSESHCRQDSVGIDPSLYRECDRHTGKKAKFFKIEGAGELLLFCSDCAFQAASSGANITSLDSKEKTGTYPKTLA